MEATAVWPYLPTLERLALALAVGLFVGLERERRNKEAGLRTFGFVALVGAVGGLLGTPFALAALGLVGLLVALLNVDVIRRGVGVELTTSAALFVTAMAGLLAGLGHTFTPTALGVATAALLASKEPLAGFSKGLTEKELRSAILLAILGLIVFPVLPTGSLDPWDLIEPRAAWLTVLLIATLGFVNYILLRLYGERGVTFTGILGGLVNSTVTVTELSDLAREIGPGFAAIAYRGILLSTAAMVARNAVILFFLSPQGLASVWVPLAVMLVSSLVAAFLWRRPVLGGPPDHERGSAPRLPLESPFSVTSALKFGLLFVLLQVGGTFAQRASGRFGFLLVSVAGGLASSASAVASAGSLAAHGTLLPARAGLGAVLASIASALVNIPIIARVGGQPALTRRAGLALLAVSALTLVALI